MVSSSSLNSWSSLILWTAWEAQWHAYPDRRRWERRKHYPSESRIIPWDTVLSRTLLYSYPATLSAHVKRFSTDISQSSCQNVVLFFPTLHVFSLCPPLKHFPQSTYVTTLFVLQLLWRQNDDSYLYCSFKLLAQCRSVEQAHWINDKEMNKLPQGGALFFSILANLYTRMIDSIAPVF